MIKLGKRGTRFVKMLRNFCNLSVWIPDLVVKSVNARFFVRVDRIKGLKQGTVLFS